MKAIRLYGDSCLRALSSLFVEPHIFARMDDRVRTFYGVHKLFDSIQAGDALVYGAIQKDDIGDRLLGVIYGWYSYGDEFVVHAAFRRNVDAVKCCFEIEKLIISDFKNRGVDLKYITGHIPDSNRASRILARKYGSKPGGDDEMIPNSFIQNGIYEHCRPWRKYVGG